MTEELIQNENQDYNIEKPGFAKKSKNNYFLHILLFIATFFTTTIAGIVWLNIEHFYELEYFQMGLNYSISLIFILSCHEFGHYFASKYHKVDATLPFFIPIPAIPGFLNFGTLGAVIKTRSAIPSTKAMFDIGAAGPISGFIACLIVLIWGFTHLPDIGYLYHIHPEYITQGIATNGLTFGNNLLYSGMSKLFVGLSGGFLPPMNEIYHYPFLCTGWFGLFVTALNLIPVGQLDGGHISYTMLGYDGHKWLARIILVLLVIFGLLGILSIIDQSLQYGWLGWLIWSLILFFVIKPDHPRIGTNFEPLDPTRRLLGWITFVIFILCFTPLPFSIYF